MNRTRGVRRGRGVRSRGGGATSSDEIKRGKWRKEAPWWGVSSSDEMARGVSRGKGVRGRRGGASTSDEMTRRVGRGRRVRKNCGEMSSGEGPGSKRPMLDMPSIYKMEDLPTGVSLHPKRKRTRSPCETATAEQDLVDQPTLAVSARADLTEADDVVCKEEPNDTHCKTATAEQDLVDQSTLAVSALADLTEADGVVFKEEPNDTNFVECDSASDTTLVVEDIEISKRRYLRDEPILGSESESEDEDFEISLPLTRVCRAALDTPLDGKAQPPPPVMETSFYDGVVGPTNFYDFEWKSFPNPSIPLESRRETFSQSSLGPSIPFGNPYDAFTAVWEPQIMEHIAKETNRYAQQLALLKMENNLIFPHSRINSWRDITLDEIWVYFALVLAMGIVVKSRIEDYWSTDADIFETPGFRVHMTLRRFQQVSRCLHFNNNDEMCARKLSESEAKLFKIQPILDHLNKRFQSLYTPRQNIALDESLLMLKGWLDINQRVTDKAAKLGIKTCEICESQTGYLWRFEVHANKSTPMPQQKDPMEASTPATVLRLTHGLENKGYTLWMDNLYSSPALARKLKTSGFDCVGTLRTDRQFVPQELNKLTKANMNPGQIAGYTSGDVDVMVWRDNNRVAAISTYHGIATTLDGTKPTLMQDYNVVMGGIDRRDEMLALYPIERKRSRVWYKKFFRRLLNVSVLNSFILLKQSPVMASSSFSTQRVFRITLVKSILLKHGPTSLPIRPTSEYKWDIKFHHLDTYDFQPGHGDPDKRPGRIRRQCVVCKKRVTFFCVGCQKTFCMNPCFVTYHS